MVVQPSLDSSKQPSSLSVDPVITRPKWSNREFDSQPAASTEEQRFRHHRWPQARLWVWEALQRTGSSERQLDAFANCGNSLWLVASGDEIALRCNTCRHRHCEACANEKRAGLVAAVTRRLQQARERCRFVTFTLKCQPVPLVDQLERLLASLRRLRQRRWWMSRVEGGCVFIEVKLGANSLAWHVHAHVLVEGKFLEQKELSAEWHAVTGDSFIVDCRRIAEDAKIAAYVAKYATKPAHSAVLSSPDKLDEAIVALRGRRLVVPFGSWMGLDAEDPEPTATFRSIGRVDTLAADARRGDPDALRWWIAATRKFPHLATHFGAPRSLSTDANSAEASPPRGTGGLSP